MKCPHCAEEIAENLKQCPVCNESLVNSCKFCKEEIAQGAIKCKHCGAMQNAVVTPTDNTGSSNTSGMGDKAIMPDELKGWSWGAFFFSWIWGIFNNSFLTFLTFVPVVNFVWVFVCGSKGKEWAWRNKKWDDIEHFKRVQRKWSIAVLWLFLPVMILVTAAVAVPAYNSYVEKSREAREAVATNLAGTCATIAATLSSGGNEVSKQIILDQTTLPTGYTMDIDNQSVWIYFDGPGSPVVVAWR